MSKTRIPEKRGGLFSLICVMAGVFLGLYPLLAQKVNEYTAITDIRYLTEQTDHMEYEEKKQYFDEARSYNQALVKKQVQPEETGEEEKNVLTYADMLHFDASGIIGFLEIPVIDIFLPVYHGTDTGVLQKGIGHLEGSSLPVGGESTHAVFAGHTGQRTAKLFTDLALMEKGDLFFFTVLGEKLAYCVDSITVCLPEDTDALSIEPGEDHITLVTCTPYGINDHRLLVRGTRSEWNQNACVGAKEKKQQGSLWMKAYKKALLTGIMLAGFFTGVFSGIRSIKNYRKKHCSVCPKGIRKEK